jgi:hypothetical protein
MDQTNELVLLWRAGVPLAMIVEKTGHTPSAIRNRIFRLRTWGVELPEVGEETPRIPESDPLLARLRQHHHERDH